jgi:hypothetical protein
MDELTQYLLSDRKTHPKISPEMLEMMGKQAANSLYEDGRSMTTTIAKLASAYPDINSEQVKRICEFANTAAHLHQHDNAKTAGADSSYPQFDLADPARVLQELSNGARAVHVPATDPSYARAPEHKAKVSNAAEDALADMFHVKTAQAEPEYAPNAVLNEVFKTKDDLKSLRDHLASSAESLDFGWKTASDELYDLTKRHILDGGSLADIVKVAKASGISSEQATDTLQPVVIRLLKEKVATPLQLKQQALDYIKVAHRDLNENHPLVMTFRAVASLDEEVTKVAAALKEAEEQLGRVDAFLKEQVRAGASR